jgi:hypothetical protein
VPASDVPVLPPQFNAKIDPFSSEAKATQAA